MSPDQGFAPVQSQSQEQEEVRRQEGLGKPQPVGASERLPFLDILRGFALLGIMIVNYFLIADSANGLTAPAEDIGHRMVHWFAEGKFYTLFSFLFGAGFVLFMSRAERRRPRPRRLFARRLMILLVFGLLHITFVWTGDVLLIYAVTGFLLLAFYARKPKTLIAWIIGLLAVFNLLPFSMLLLLAALDPTYSDTAGAGSASYGMDISYLQSIGHRWADIGVIWGSGILMMLSVLPMFLLGAYAVRSGLFSQMEEKKRVWRRIWVVCALGFVAAQTLYIYGTVQDPADLTTNYEALAFLGQTLGGLAGSMFYMSSLAMLYLYVAKLRQWLVLIGNIGRMSLTCYIAHSGAGTFLFLGYGFGAAERIQPWGILAICFGIYAVLMVFSYAWLKRFRYGPLEWLWRKLTYGRVVSKGNSAAVDRSNYTVH